MSGTTAMVMKQQEALREVQLQLQWLTDRLQLEGLRQAGKIQMGNGGCCVAKIVSDSLCTYNYLYRY